jgi:hypothetical protein
MNTAQEIIPASIGDGASAVRHLEEVEKLNALHDETRENIPQRVAPDVSAAPYEAALKQARAIAFPSDEPQPSEPEKI